MSWSEGDRIELVSMPDDPDPIEVGAKGTITWVYTATDFIPYTQVSVDWDNGRRLGVVIPPDEIRQVPPSRDWQPPDVVAADQERGL